MNLEDFKEYADTTKRGYCPFKEGKFRRISKEHADNHTKGEIGLINLVVVHPYFNEFKKGVKNVEVDRIEYLVHNLPRNFKRVLFDTAEHHVLKSHELVENGLIDRVFITLGGSGDVIDFVGLMDFKNTLRNYFVGCYLNQCVEKAAYNINVYAPKEGIKLVTDCCINNRDRNDHHYQTTTSSELLLLR